MAFWPFKHRSKLGQGEEEVISQAYDAAQPIKEAAIDPAALNSAFSALVDGLMEAPEIREAALSRADIELALEDANWIRLGKSAEMDTISRRAVVERARLYWHRDPLAKQAVRLWTDYSVSTGMSFRAKDEKAQTLLETFYKHRKNRKLLGPEGQRKSSHKLLIDGEVFFTFFKGDPPLLRRIDPLQISKIITHPEDEETPIYYQRDFAIDTGGQVTRFYRDWALEKEEEDEVAGKVKNANGQAVDAEKVEQDVVLYHVPLDPLGNRGNSLLTPALDWLREHRRFMQARVAITQALARFVMKAKVKGGPATLEAARKTLASALTQGSDTETNPPAAAGSTWFENQGMDLSAITRKSGAGEARNDSDMFKLMISAGVNIMLHYFGDPSCYAEDTEVLTEKGFMLHSEWKSGIRVACFNPASHETELHEPYELRTFDYEGEMISFRNAQTDILVTPNHRMWTAPHSQWKRLPALLRAEGGSGRPRIADGGSEILDRDWRLLEAKEIFVHPRTHGWRFVGAAGYSTPDIDRMETCLGKVKAQTWARFLGYWLADGWTVSTRVGMLGLCKGRGSPVLEKMRDTLHELGFSFHESENQSGVPMLTWKNQRLWEWLREWGGIGAHGKRIPEELFHAGTKTRAQLFAALMECDGGPSGASLRYTSVSKELADGMQRLALSLGYGAAVTLEIREYKDKPYPIWRVWIRRKWLETKIRPQHVGSELYRGKVFCFHLPHHLYVTRRNGKIAIQGNTGNLATATAMELPMLKAFLAYQTLWGGVYGDFDTIVLDQAEFKGERFVDRDWPPIIEADIGVLATAITAFGQAMPGLMEQPEMVQRVLTALRINNPQEIIQRMQGAQPKEPLSPESAARLAVTLREFREGLTHELHSSA